MAYRTSDTPAAVHNSSSCTNAGITTQSGDFLVLIITVDGGTLSSVTDSKGNSLTQIGTTYNPGGAVNLYAYYCALTSVGTGHTWTASTGGPGYDIVLEPLIFSGRASSSPIDASGHSIDTGFIQNHNNGQTNAVPASLTTVTAGCDIIAISSEIGGSTTSTEAGFTVGAGYTQAQAFLGPSGTIASPALYEYMNAASVGTYYAGCQSTNFAENASLIIAIKPTSGVSYALSASYGPFAISGQAVSFSVSTSIPNLLAASGTFNITGAPASSDYQAPFAAGSYSYSGQSVALSVVTAAQTLTAATGHYSIAAQTAILAFFVPPAGSFPSVIGQYYWIATLMLQQAGALNPATLGYFGTDPITLRWQKSTLAPGTVIAQSVAPGTLNFKTNSPITLTVSEFPMGAAYPGGGTLTGGVA